MERNTLYYGDSLDVLQRHVKDDSIDLVYLDPPFNSESDMLAYLAMMAAARRPSNVSYEAAGNEGR